MVLSFHTWLTSCWPSHHASWPLPGYMMTLASDLTWVAAGDALFCVSSSSVKTNQPCSVIKSETCTQWPFPFFQRGCCPSFTQTWCRCSLVWNILSSWNTGICSLLAKTVGNGSISFPSYSRKNLMWSSSSLSQIYIGWHTFHTHYPLTYGQ